MKIIDKRITGLRTDYDVPDDIWEADCKPFDDAIDSWLDNHINVLEEFIAFYIATGIKDNSLWNGTFSGLINSAVDTCCQHYDSDDINVDNVIKSLLEKHNIKTVDKDKTIKFEVLK